MQRAAHTAFRQAQSHRGSPLATTRCTFKATSPIAKCMPQLCPPCGQRNHKSISPNVFAAKSWHLYAALNRILLGLPPFVLPGYSGDAPPHPPKLRSTLTVRPYPLPYPLRMA